MNFRSNSPLQQGVRLSNRFSKRQLGYAWVALATLACSTDENGAESDTPLGSTVPSATETSATGSPGPSGAVSPGADPSESSGPVDVPSTGGVGGADVSGGGVGNATGATGGTSGTAPDANNGGMGGQPTPVDDAGAPAQTAGGAGEGGSTNPSMPGDGDSFIDEVTVEVHPDVNTLLVVNWTQVQAVDETYLEFTFEGGDVMTSAAKPGEAGEHQDVVIGVPGDTEVTVRIISSDANGEHASSDYLQTTEPVPQGMPVPEVVSYDAALASPDRWMFGAVENSDGGCSNSSCYYHTTFWLYIMDRQGRIVWYYADPASNATSSFQRIARDGEYIWIEKRPIGGSSSRSVLKMTLDWEYYEDIPVEDLSDCIDVTDDGSLLYDVVGDFELREMTADGDERTIWNCGDHFGGNFECYSNTVNWNSIDDTVLLSFPYENTVIEVDRESGEVVGQYGDAAGSYAFEPSTWEFQFQHFANITKDGTLMVSSHMPGNDVTEDPTEYEHAFIEFDIDRENETLVERWFYDEGPEWAMYKGMAIKLPNDNVLANYGTGGVIREITPEKETAFHVKFDVDDGDDFFNKMVGHNVLIDDLYALNGGPD